MKLAAIALAFTIPLIVTTWFLVREEQLEIDFTDAELRGDDYIRPVSDLLVHLAVHESYVREGDSTQAGRVEALVDEDLQRLAEVDAELGEHLETDGESLSARSRGDAEPSRIQASWERVKLAGDDEAGERQRQALVEDVHDLISHVGDTSKLILDPDLDTYYVMDALLLKEPEIVEMLGALSRGSAGPAVLALLEYQVDGLRADLDTAYVETSRFNENEGLQPALAPLHERARAATQAAAQTLEPVAVRDAIDAHSALWTELIDQEDVMLQHRRDESLGRRSFALTTVAIAVVLAAALTLLVARRISRNVGEVADAAGHLSRGDLTKRATVRSRDEVGTMATSFNTMADSLDALVTSVIGASVEISTSATQLSSAADELAATTTEQSAAVTEASATTEELARASAAIADTVDGVAAQASETRDNLEQAEADIDVSAARTVSLAGKMGEIGAILALINEIADQTNLLALNAAIEAARAGEGGRGFAVVADEVRRLAERSKSSAAGIAEIVEGIQEETNATVLAMEQGAKQMQAGLGLLTSVTDGTAQVRLTTQQQRSATAQVVETMEQLADASRQVSATATQIASASSRLAELAAELEQTGASAKSDATT